MPEWRTPQSAAGRVPRQEELAAFLAEAAELSSLGAGRRPLPAVLDTDFIRTGLHAQLSKGVPPRSVRSAQDGALRLFMEYDTLVETGEKLPRFAGQLGVTVPELRRILNEEWLPHIDVVRLPAGLRELDPRAPRVRDGDGVRRGDEDDFPAAALAALLSPCLLLTHNYKHFGALGVRTRTQGVDGIMAVLAIHIGEVQLQAVIWLPALPVPRRGRRHGMGHGEDRPMGLGDPGCRGRRRHLLVPQAATGAPRPDQDRGRPGCHPHHAGVQQGRRRYPSGSPATPGLHGTQARAPDTHIRDPARIGALARVAVRGSARGTARSIRTPRGCRDPGLPASQRQDGGQPGAPRRLHARLQVPAAGLRRGTMREPASLPQRDQTQDA